MSPSLARISEMYRVTRYLFDKALNEVQSETVHTRPLDRANSFLFVAGHLTGARFQVARLLGLDEQWKHGPLFDRGVEPAGSDNYPSLDEIKLAFDDISDKIEKRFGVITDDDLQGEPPFHVSPIENSIGGLVAFMQLHESYHIGQLAYLLRLHGGERLVG